MTKSSPELEPLRVAIIGGGLVGLFATIALSKLSNVQVTTFEKSIGPNEAGAWISLTESGLNILSNFINIDELHSITATPGTNQLYKYLDWKTEEVVNLQSSITSKNFKYASSKTHRSALLKILLKHIPEGSVKYGHYINSIDYSNSENTVSLKYKKTDDSNDEEVYKQEFDLLVAADGIYSKIRTQIYPEITVVSRGMVAYRNLFSEDLVKHIEGYRQEEGTLAFKSDTEIVFMSPLGLGTYGLVLIVPESKEVIDSLRWNSKINEDDFQRIKDHFKGWPKFVNQLLEASPYLNAFPLESAPWLEHLSYKNKVVFVGDAAHPTSGVYGSGAAFGFGDIWALYRSLQESGSNASKRKRAKFNGRSIDEKEIKPEKYKLKPALFLFDETRRHFLKDVYEQLGRDRKYSEFIQEAENHDEKIERVVEAGSHANWYREHNVELEFQRVKAKNIDVLYDI